MQRVGNRTTPRQIKAISGWKTRLLRHESQREYCKMKRSGTKSPSFSGLRPRSMKTSRCARASSRKGDTKPEMILRRGLRASGLRFRTSVNLPGKPDIVFPRQRIAIFVDGDFWHGKNLRARLARLSRGHNAKYWTAKITANCARDKRLRAVLTQLGWKVVRVWESDLYQRVESTTHRIMALVRKEAGKFARGKMDRV